VEETTLNSIEEKRHWDVQGKKISLLMPTRGRPAWAERFFRSVAQHSSHPDRVEVILYVDDDDTGSHHLDSSEIHVVRIIGPRKTMGEYNSACLERAQGDIIILVNDDMVIQTRGWDEKVAALDAGYSDGIYLAYGNDLFKGGALCTFPILSRRTCEVLVEPYPKAYHGAFIDYHLFDIFKRLQCAGVDRICYLDDVVFEHLHFRAGKAKADETYTKRGRFDDDATFLSLTDLRRQSAQRLRIAIKGETLPSEQRTGSGPELPPSGLVASVMFLTRKLLLDRELPLRWRFFLWYWFIGRYLAAHGYLGPLVR